MSLFQLGDFILHSKGRSYFKIDCDFLTDSDLKCLARIIYETNPHFGRVIGIPKGGLKLADHLKDYAFPNPTYPTLIVDDVLTTGRSMEEMRQKVSGNCIGAVIFARGKYPDWVKPVIRLEDE